MSLKLPVTLAQARRWPAAAKRRESFCARMGGMRDKRTGEDAATDLSDDLAIDGDRRFGDALDQGNHRHILRGGPAGVNAQDSD